MKNVWGLLRIGLGWIFLWAFFDKLLGLGFSTTVEKSWLNGASPTSGFLMNATHGPFKSIFTSLVGNTFIDWLFMMGLLLIGLALILGIGMKIAVYSGSIFLFLIWLSIIPPTTNPFLDDHIIYIFVLLGLKEVNAQDSLGFGKAWKNSELVKKYPILQ